MRRDPSRNRKGFRPHHNEGDDISDSGHTWIVIKKNGKTIKIAGLYPGGEVDCCGVTAAVIGVGAGMVVQVGQGTPTVSVTRQATKEQVEAAIAKIEEDAETPPTFKLIPNDWGENCTTWAIKVWGAAGGSFSDVFGGKNKSTFCMTPYSLAGELRYFPPPDAVVQVHK